MSAKKKTYSADFKAKVVLELLSEGSTLNQIASKYEITHQREVADLRAAGLNPALSATGAGASSPGGASSTNTAPILGDIGTQLAAAKQLKIQTKQAVS